MTPTTTTTTTTTIASKLFCFSLFVASLVGFVHTVCEPKDICKTYNGFCIAKVDAHHCEGNVFNKGCVGKECSCCVKNTTICIAKPHCENNEQGGFCMAPGTDWQTCNGAVDSSGCHGDGCACCKKEACQATSDCESDGDYCYLVDSNHKCTGNSVPTGCTGDDCACCKKQ